MSGGALVHAQALERTIEARRAEQAQALARASAPPGVHLGYILLISIIMGSCLLAGYFMLTFLAAADFSAGFMIAAGMGGAGLMLNLGMLVARYNHDAWEAPGGDWIHVKGQVTSVKEVHTDEGLVAWELRYEFPVRARRFEQQLLLRRKPPAGCLWSALDVYYPPGRPQNSEVTDFLHEARRGAGVSEQV
jgi:hypothetical protein